MLLNVWKINIYCLLTKFNYRGIIFEYIFENQELHLHFSFEDQVKFYVLTMHL